MLGLEIAFLIKNLQLRYPRKKIQLVIREDIVEDLVKSFDLNFPEVMFERVAITVV